MESTEKRRLSVVEKLDGVTEDTAPGRGNITTDEEATALSLHDERAENLSDVNLVRTGGSSGCQPTPHAPPVTRQRARTVAERLKRRRSSAADSEVGAAVDVTLDCGDVTASFDKVEQSGLSSADDTAVGALRHLTPNSPRLTKTLSQLSL